MKALLSILLLFNTTDQLDDRYKLALYEIKKTELFNTFTNKGNKKIQVVPQLIPLHKIGFGFHEELQEHTGIDYLNLDNNQIIAEYQQLVEISEARKSKLKSFFSPIKSEIIIVELAYSESKNSYDYDSITNFGMTIVYFIRFRDKAIVELIGEKRHNN